MCEEGKNGKEDVLDDIKDDGEDVPTLVLSPDKVDIFSYDLLVIFLIMRLLVAWVR